MNKPLVFFFFFDFTHSLFQITYAYDLLGSISSIFLMQVTWAKDIGAPHQFCFSDYDQETYLIPVLPELTPLAAQIALAYYSDKNEHGVVYNHFRKLRDTKVTGSTLFNLISVQNSAGPTKLNKEILTPEQLAVFKGPKKQLIIGAPGSGKTALMKLKALELEFELKVTTKILHIVAAGSPSGESLLSHQIKRFFKKSNSTLVEVMTIVLEEENPELLGKTEAKLREMMASGEYGHVFIDEYWIGSQPPEHAIILELVSRIPGYVWISSVFDYDPNNKKYPVRTKPLIDAVEKEGGIVSRITQVIRATNTIVKLQRDYSAFYRGCPYPYETERIHGHSCEGLPIMWTTADNIDGMYDECLKVVASTIKDPIMQTSTLKTKKLMLNPGDILIVNFAVRTMESLSVTPSLEGRLMNANIPIWLFGDNPELFMNRDAGKVTLLNSPTREDSTHLDGVEWPVVVIILPSGVLVNTAELAPNAERLRNYDTYISCFRTQVKLVVISDKWTDEKMFLNDIELKFK